MKDLVNRLKMIVYISIFLFTANSFAGKYSFSSCQDALKNNFISCEHARFDDILPRSWKDFEKVIQNVGYDDAQNPEDQFFLDIKKELKNTIKFNQTKMKFKKKCLELLEHPVEQRDAQVVKYFPSLGVNSSQKAGIVARCEASIAILKGKIRKNFYLMQEGLNIGWSSITTTAPYSSVGITRDKDTKVSMIGIPATKSGKKHVLSIHDTQLDKIKKSDLDKINEKMYIELSEHLKKLDFGNSEGINDESFLESIKDLSVVERINKIKKRVQNYSPKGFTRNRKSSFNSGWDIQRKSAYQEQYFKAISETPLIAHLPNGNGDSKDLLSAFDTFIDNSDEFLKRLEPNSKNPLKLKHLANFKPVINKYLEKNFDKCNLAESWINSKRKKDAKAVKWQVGRVGVLLTGCFAGGFLAQTGIGVGVAAAGCTAGGAGLAGYDIHQANIKRNQVAQETSLNATELLARDFNDLNSAEKELYLNIALLPLELIGARAALEGGFVASRAIRGSATEADKALTKRGEKLLSRKTSQTNAGERSPVISDEQYGKALDGDPSIKTSRAVSSADSQYAELIDEAINNSQTAFLKNIRSGDDIIPRINSTLDEAIKSGEIYSHKLKTKEIESLKHQKDILDGVRNNPELLRKLEQNGFDLENYLQGTYQSDLGKLKPYSELLTEKSAKSDILLDFLKGHGPPESVNVLKEVLSEMGHNGTLLGADLSNKSIREVFKNNPILKGYLHEFPGMSDAVLAFQKGLITKGDLKKQLSANLFHNGPSQGFWQLLEDAFIPGAVKGANQQENVASLFRGTVFDTSKGSGSVVKPTYGKPHSFESFVGTFMDRMSQGTRGGYRKIDAEIPGDPLDNIINLGGETSIKGTRAQIANLEELAKSSTHLTEGQRTTIQKMAEAGAKYLDRYLERSKRTLITSKDQDGNVIRGGPFSSEKVPELSIKHNDSSGKITRLKRQGDGSYLYEVVQGENILSSRTLASETAGDDIRKIYDDFLAQDEALHGDPMRELTFDF